jgi:hypothetical protein
MSRNMHNHLRPHRLATGFTLSETSFLLGSHTSDADKVYRYERLSDTPNLQTALAYQILFSIPAHELFFGVYRKVEQRMRARADALAKTINETPGYGWTKLKQDHLCRLISSLERKEL